MTPLRTKTRSIIADHVPKLQISADYQTIFRHTTNYLLKKNEDSLKAANRTDTDHSFIPGLYMPALSI